MLRRCVCLILVIVSCAGHARFPDFPLPDHGRAEIILEEAVVDGALTQVWKYYSSQPTAVTQQFYQQVWSEPAESDWLDAQADTGSIPGFVENNIDDMLIISRIQDNLLYTVSLLNDGQSLRTEGLLSITVLSDEPINYPEPGFLDLDGRAKNVYRISSQDGPKKSQTITAFTSLSLRQAKKFYSAKFKRHGWQMVEGTDRHQGSDKTALLFNKNGDEINLALVKTVAGTHITLVHVDQ